MKALMLKSMVMVLGMTSTVDRVCGMQMYRSDPEFWDGILAILDTDEMFKAQADMDQLAAELRGIMKEIIDGV